MSTAKPVSSTSTPTTSITRRSANEPGYSTGRGCLTMSIILAVLLALSIAGILLLGNHMQ